MRKLAMWALCLIMVAEKDKLRCLPPDFSRELLFFKEEIENNNPVDGKVQLNPIPSIVKRMLMKDPNVLIKMKTETHSLVSEPSIWTFPKFKPINTVVSITEALSHEEQGLLTSPHSYGQQPLSKLSPNFGQQVERPLRLAETTDPVKFAEMFPDPQDYCIGVNLALLTVEPPFRQTRVGKSDHLTSLDARIEQELKKQDES